MRPPARIPLLGLLAMLSSGCCSSPPDLAPEPADGAYRGRTDDGRDVQIVLQHLDGAYVGVGTVGTSHVTFVEGGSPVIGGQLLHDDGTTEAVEFRVGGDRRAAEGVAATTLLETVGPATLSLGPATGRYAGGRLIEALSLYQNGDVLSGRALVMGRSYGVVAWVGDGGHFQGQLFDAEGASMMLWGRVVPGGDVEFRTGRLVERLQRRDGGS